MQCSSSCDSDLLSNLLGWSHHLLAHQTSWKHQRCWNLTWELALFCSTQFRAPRISLLSEFSQTLQALLYPAVDIVAERKSWYGGLKFNRFAIYCHWGPPACHLFSADCTLALGAGNFADSTFQIYSHSSTWRLRALDFRPFFCTSCSHTSFQSHSGNCSLRFAVFLLCLRSSLPTWEETTNCCYRRIVFFGAAHFLGHWWPCYFSLTCCCCSKEILGP